MTEFNQSLEENLSLTDVLVARLWLGLILEESLSFSDELLKTTTFRRTLTEEFSLGDLGTTRRVGWNRSLGEALATPDQLLVVRDAWAVIKRTVVPEMYQLENWSKVFEFLELFGHEYNRVMGYVDSFPRLTGVRTAPAHLVPNLLRLLGREIDTQKSLAEQVDELEKTVDVYKRRGRTNILERAVGLLNPEANAAVDFPDDEVLRWSEQPEGGWSSGAVWGDKLEYNHHVARLTIAISLPDFEEKVAPWVPAGVNLVVNIGSTIITETVYGGGSVLGEEFQGQLDDEPAVFVLPTLFMGDTSWYMGDSDKYISDEANVNRQPFDVFEAGTLHRYYGDELVVEDQNGMLAELENPAGEGTFYKQVSDDLTTEDDANGAIG